MSRWATLKRSHSRRSKYHKEYVCQIVDLTLLILHGMLEWFGDGYGGQQQAIRGDLNGIYRLRFHY